MSLQLRDIRLCLEEDESCLALKVAHHLSLDPSQISDLRILRKGIDARKKPRVLRVYTVRFEVDNEEQLLARLGGMAELSRFETTEISKISPLKRRPSVVVVGMGPAGLFAAWQLARHGVAVTLLERGRPVEQRVRDVASFWQRGDLNPRSNVQFGEGGAGTFSDGKLTTRLRHPEIALILRTLVEFGAPEEILWMAKPHIGTDILQRVLRNFRQALIELGVRIRFETRFTLPLMHQGRLCAARLEGGEEIPCEMLVLAPGHSARDTYRELYRSGVRMAAKPFAVGVRIEHPAEMINEIQYGFRSHPELGTADYSLSFNDSKTGRGVYSFCMCPGGEVVNASSEPGRLVVNGMSLSRRASEYSNSALVVSVREEDFSVPGALGGLAFQETLEEQAFIAGGGNWLAPAQNVASFLGRSGGTLRSSCRPGVREADLATLLPAVVVDGLRQALPQFDRRMKGFASAEAVLVGVETRTSAPLRILRADNGQSLSHPGLYPAGEGAGYAGGIMSAALDGLRAAGNILEPLLDRSEH